MNKLVIFLLIFAPHIVQASPNEVVELIKKGSLKDAGQLYKSSNFKPEDYDFMAKSIYDFASTRKIDDYVKSINEETSVKTLGTTIGMGQEIAKKGCALKSAESCATKVKLDKLDKDLRAYFNKIEREESENDAKEMLSVACDAKSNFDTYSKQIKDEKEIGKISGAVDLTRLHDAGEMVRNNASKMKEAEARFKKLTGKKIDYKKCQ